MRRIAAAVLVALVCACGPAGASSSTTTPPTAHAVIPSPVQLPSPATNPNYPPVNLADIVALGDAGLTRRFLGAEGQSLGPCSRGWDRIFEPAATAARQRAADLVRFAFTKQLFTKSCGGMVFGTEDPSFSCNCYHGENGYLEIDRGAAQAPAPGKMQVIFQAVENHPSAADWDITVDAPTG